MMKRIAIAAALLVCGLSAPTFAQNRPPVSYFTAGGAASSVSPIFSGTVTFPDSCTWSATGVLCAQANTTFNWSPTGTGTVTLNPATAGTLNNIVIGGSTAAAGSFTTLSASSTVSGAGFSTYLASPPAIGGSAPAAGSFTTLGATGLISPASAIGIKGTATNDSAQAASIGEMIEANCSVGTSGASIAFTNATPTVGTWVSPPWSGTGTYACPMNITANAPTGLSTATNYWVTAINATTFHVSTTAANALAGTYAATSGTSATANLTTTALITTTNTFNLGSVALTAGDWDCSALAIYTPASTTSVTNLQQGISQTSATQGAFGTYTDFESAANVFTATSNPVWAVPAVRESLSGTTNVYSVTTTIFSANTLAASSDIRCRRMR